MNKTKVIMITITITILYNSLMCAWWTGLKEAKGETVGCMVICEVPEDKIEYIIPKMKGQKMIFCR